MSEVLAEFGFCLECPLVGGTVVEGYGPPPGQARCVIIGEAPGREELAAGRPFVGQSGKLLRRVLEHVGIDPESVYMTNVLLCRPRGKPPPGAIACCRRRLAEELQPYGAAVPGATEASGNTPFAALGATATRVIVGAGAGGIGRARGKWHRGGRVMATWHPAGVLREPARITELLTDMAKLARGGPMKVPYPEYRVLRTVDEVDEAWTFLRQAASAHRVSFNRPLTLCIDLETDQVTFWKYDVLCMAIAYDVDNAFVIPRELLYQPTRIAMLEKLFANESLEFVGHNVKFDLKFLRYQLGVRNARAEYDSLIAHYVLDENARHALKLLLREYFDIEDYEDALVQRYLRSKKDYYSKVPPERLMEYNALDVCYNLRLWHKLREDLIASGMFEHPFMYPLMKSQKALLHMELAGIYVNTEQLKWVSGQLGEGTAEVHKQLETMCGKSFNPNSWKQVQPIMYEHYKMPLVSGRNFKKGSTSAGARMLILQKLPENSEGAEWLRIFGEYKSLAKLKSSYVDNMFDHLDEDQRVHPDFLVYGTEDGRLSARTPAIQSVPRPGSGDAYGDTWGRHIRGAFCAPEGYVILQADYSQAEMRTAAAMSQDPFLLEVYRGDRDLHSEVAVAMFGEDYTKEQRFVCKCFNFSYLYGGSERAFATISAGKVMLGMRVAKQYYRKYQEVMPVLSAWRDDQYTTLRSIGYVTTPTGRRRRFPLVTRANADEARKASVHAPIAGTASDLTLISLTEMHEWLRAQKHYDVALIITVHDSIVVEVPEAKVPLVAAKIKVVMEQVGNRTFPQLPWKADIEVGPSWGALETYEL